MYHLLSYPAGFTPAATRTQHWRAGSMTKKEFNSTPEGQKAMFWGAHRHVADKNLVVALDLARAARHAAVRAWRAAGAKDEDWVAYTAEADRAVDAAEASL